MYFFDAILVYYYDLFSEVNIPYVYDFRFIHMLSCMSATENWDGSHKCKVFFLDSLLMNKLMIIDTCP